MKSSNGTCTGGEGRRGRGQKQGLVQRQGIKGDEVNAVAYGQRLPFVVISVVVVVVYASHFRCVFGWTNGWMDECASVQYTITYL